MKTTETYAACLEKYFEPESIKLALARNPFFNIDENAQKALIEFFAAYTINTHIKAIPEEELRALEKQADKKIWLGGLKNTIGILGIKKAPTHLKQIFKTAAIIIQTTDWIGLFDEASNKLIMQPEYEALFQKIAAHQESKQEEPQESFLDQLHSQYFG